MNPDWNVRHSLMPVINARYTLSGFSIAKGRSARNRARASARACLRACIQRVDVCETNRNARSFSKQRWWNDLPRANAISIPGLMSPVSTISIPFSLSRPSESPKEDYFSLRPFVHFLSSFSFCQNVFPSPLSDENTRQVEALRFWVKNRSNYLTVVKHFVQTFCLTITKLFLSGFYFSNVLFKCCTYCQNREPLLEDLSRV